MLTTASDRLLPPAKAATDLLIDRAREAGIAIDVLTAKDMAEAAEECAEALRQGLKYRATDMALRAIVAKLEGIKAGDGRLDHLLAVVAALDPAGRGPSGAGGLSVEVIVRAER